MKLKNKKISKTITIIAFVLLIFLSFMAVNTFSKYITEVNGKSLGTVAKWNFKVNNSVEDLGVIKLNQTVSPKTLVDGKIAPGTSGKFDLIIDATENETGVFYKVDFQNETKKPQNLKFKYNGVVVQSLEGLEEFLQGEIMASDSEKTKTLTIHWFWNYETGTSKNEIESKDNIDTIDSQLIENYSFSILVSGTQLMPT